MNHYNVGKTNGRHQHGLYKSAEYKVWGNMKSRCLNPNHPRFKDWGGRGITFAEEWRDFVRFYADMGQRPSANHTLERKDNNVGYSKENCYWATTSEQSLNRRSTRTLTHKGKTLPMRAWATLLGMNYVTLASRKLRGWSDAEALEGRRYVA